MNELMNIEIGTVVGITLILIIAIVIWHVKIKKYFDRIKKAAQNIDNYIISLEKPSDLQDERHMNIVTNLKTVLMVNRRTIDSYFDKFNKLERKIKKLECKLVTIKISMRNGIYVAISEDLPGLFVVDKNIADLCNEIPEVIKAIKYETKRDTKRARKAQKRINGNA